MKTQKTIGTLKAYFHLAAILGLFLIPRTGLAASISCGQTVTGTTTSPSENDTFTFSGGVGEKIAISLWGGLSGYNNSDTMVADIYDPSGNLLASVQTGNSGYQGNSGGVGVMTLPAAGTYTILVHSGGYVLTASYALSLQSVKGGGCAAQTIACGQTISAATTVNSEMDAYSFSGSAGQPIAISLWGGLSGYNNSDTMVADVYDPNGNLLASVQTGNSGYQGNSGGVGVMTLPAAGTYTILVHSGGYVLTASYALSLQSVKGGGCAAQTIACGQTISAATTVNSEMDAYSFSGSAGQPIEISLWGGLSGYNNSDTMVADVYDPNGNLLASVQTGNSGYQGNSGGAGVMTLPAAGTYTILVHSGGYVLTASYALSLQSVKGGGCAAQTIACGQTISAATTVNSEMDAYSFSGSAGQPIEISLWGGLSGYNNSDTMVADVYDPNGNLLASVQTGNSGYQGNSGGAGVMTLPAAGTYTILVHSGGYVLTASYALSLQSVVGGGCDGTTIPCGQPINGQVSQASQTIAYEMVANAGEHVVFSDSGFSGMVVDIYDPTGSNVVSIGPSTSTNFTFADTGIYTAVVHAGNYVLTGSYGLTLTVFGGCASLPTDSVSPANQAVPIGSPATFSAVASGPTPLFYQWWFGTNVITAATNATYSIANVQPSELGLYRVFVNNPGGAVSNSVRLQGLPLITWPTPAEITYGTPLGTTQLNATASVPGTFAYTPPNGSVLNAGNDTLSVVFTPTDVVNYSKVTNTVSLVVSPALLTITASAQNKTYGQTLNLGTTAFTTIGLVNGDTVTGVTLSSPGVAATAPVAGSPYLITAGLAVGTGLGNYTITYNPGQLTVNPAALGITASAQSKTYGQTLNLGTTTFTTSGLVNGDTVTSVTLNSPGAGATATGVGSPYAITASLAVGTGLGNYTITYNPGQLTVNPAALGITPSAESKTYGQTLNLGTTAFTTSGLVNGDTVTSVTLNSPGAGATATAVGSPYAITASLAVGTGLGNYTITYNPGLLAVNPAGLAITASAQSKTYGQTLNLGTTAFTTSGLVNGDTVTGVTLSGPGAAATVAGSPYPITASLAVGTGLGNYAITYNPGQLTVNPAALGITASAQSKMYGQTLNIGTTAFTTSGLVNGDTVTGVTLSSPGAAATAPVAGSPYSIAASLAVGTGLGNYTITYNPGQLTVNPAGLGITASAQSKTYGQTLNLGTTAFTTSGLVNGDTVTSVTLSSPGAAATATVAGSAYPITASLAVGTGLGNYTITYNPGQLTVNPAALGITASAQSKTYGQTLNLGTTAFITSGLLNGDTITGVTLSSPGAPAAATVAGAPYTITASLAVGTGLGNYTITYNPGQLTVNPAALAVTASAQSKTYGQTLNIGTTAFTTSGLVNGDTVTAVTLSSPGTAATATVAGSPYSIAASLAVGTGLGNYTITYNPGLLAVNPAGLAITASAQSKTYGQTLNLGTTAVITSGLLNGDTITGVTLSSPGAPAAATVAGAPYTITASLAVGTGLGNYTITYNPGQLTVNPAALGITASAQSKTYGQTLNLGTTAFTTSGLVNGDTVTGVTLSGPGAAATVAGSPYSITASLAVGTGLGNYTITYNPGQLTVNPAALGITASAQSKTYGQTLTLGATAFTTSGLVNGDTVASVTLSSPGAAATATVAGSADTITASLAVGTGLGNYTITYNPGQLTVSPAALGITASAQSKTYGQTVVFGSGSTLFTSNGLQNGETIGSVTLTVNGNGGAPTAPVSGSPYTITPSTATGGTFTAANYSITYATGNLTVNGAALTITASPQTKTYGQPLAFGSGSTLFTSSPLQNGETVGSVTLAVSGNGGAPTAAVSGSPYTITPSAATGGTFTAANYNITSINGTLTVNPLPVSLTGSRSYDGTATAVSTILTVANVVGSDEVNVASGSATLASANVGTEAITSFGTLALGGGSAHNYTLTGANGSVTITSALPQLQFATQNNLLVLSWTTNVLGLSLQMSTNLSTPVWAPVSGGVVIGNQHFVTNNMSGTSAFFRLKL